MTHAPTIAEHKSVSSPALLPYLGLAAAILLMSMGAILVRLAQGEGLPSLVIAALRYSFAGTILAPYMLLRHRAELRQVSRRDLILIALTGSLQALRLFMMFFALEHTTVLVANALASTSVLWVAVLEVLVLKALLGRRIWLGLVLAMSGTLLFALAGFQEGHQMGSAPLLGGAVAFSAAFLGAIYLIMTRTLRARHTTLVVIWIGLSFGSVLALLVIFLSGTALTGYPLLGYGWVFIVTLTGQLGGQSLLAFSLAHLPATVVSISIQVIVLISAILAFIVFGEQPGLLQVLAGGVIVAGVIIVISVRAPAPETTHA